MTDVENLNQAPAALSLCQAPGATSGTELVTGDGNRYIFDSESPFQVVYTNRLDSSVLQWSMGTYTALDGVRAVRVLTETERDASVVAECADDSSDAELSDYEDDTVLSTLVDSMWSGTGGISRKRYQVFR